MQTIVVNGIETSEKEMVHWYLDGMCIGDVRDRVKAQDQSDRPQDVEREAKGAKDSV